MLGLYVSAQNEGVGSCWPGLRKLHTQVCMQSTSSEPAPRDYVCSLCPSVASGRLLSASELSIRPRFQQRIEQVEFPKCRLWAAQHLKQMLPCEQQPPGGRIELESKSPHDSSENSEKPQISGIDNQRITATYSGGLTPSTNACQP